MENENKINFRLKQGTQCIPVNNKIVVYKCEYDEKQKEYVSMGEYRVIAMMTEIFEICGEISVTEEENENKDEKLKEENIKKVYNTRKKYEGVFENYSEIIRDDCRIYFLVAAKNSYWEKLGETVFFTREEAFEKAEMENKILKNKTV